RQLGLRVTTISPPELMTWKVPPLHRNSAFPDLSGGSPMRVRLVGVVALAVVFLAAPIARASRLAVQGTAQGGGTLVNSGSGDVGTNDGTSQGNTSLWSDLGF